MKKTYKIEVDCAACADKMEQAAQKTQGVAAATVSFMTQKLTIEADDDRFDAIVEQAADHLTPEGWLMMEIGHDQGEDLRKMLKDSKKYTPAEVVKDLPGRDRVVKCRLKSNG